MASGEDILIAAGQPALLFLAAGTPTSHNQYTAASGTEVDPSKYSSRPPDALTANHPDGPAPRRHNRNTRRR
jgi:hypothetical protein